MSNVKTAERYYTAVGKKDMAAIETYLHPDVQLVGPLAKLTGKVAVIEANKHFTAFFKTLKIRTSCGSGDNVVIVYDLDCPAPVGKLSAAVLLTFDNELIKKLELFFDARPFENK